MSRYLSPRRPLALRRCTIGLALALAASLWPLAATAGGLTFLPERSRDDVLAGPQDLSVLTWDLPGGLLVADRLSAAAENRFGPAFAPVYPASEWFLVQPRGHAHDLAATQAELRALGHVHLTQGDACVVEIPQTNLERFAGYDLCRVRLPLDAPPTGWDRYKPTVAPAAVAAQKDAALIAAFVEEVSGPHFFQLIREISGDALFFFDSSLQSVSTRYFNTADKELVRDYLVSELAAWGYIVELDPFTYSGHACHNIVATKTGTTTPAEHVVVGGHYDSISPSPQSSAPGAEDNGSGTSLVMELARISADRDFERTVQFVLFDGEEQGLIGSEHFVDEAVTENRNIVAALLYDMVAYYDGNYAMRIEGQSAWEWLMSLMADNVDTYTDIGKQKDYFSFGSDHVPFQQAGIPAFLAIDYDWGSYPGYHRTTDTWSHISGTAGIGTQIARASAATLAEVAVLLPDATSTVDGAPRLRAPVLSAAPNPFNPRVTFSFTLDAPAAGTLAVHDLSGRRVVVLAGGSLTAGENRFVWDGTDADGRALASGAYLGRLTVGRERSVVKVNLVR